MRTAKRKFFYHYNKPLSRQRGYPVISVHYKGACHFARHLVCQVPARDKIRKRQPFFVMEGYATEMLWDKQTDTATLK
jgi:hypothetical protein